MNQPYAELTETEKLARLKAYADGFNASATLKFFGVRIEFPDTEHVRAIIDPVVDGHRGGLGSQALNGGVIAGLFDLSIGVCAALIDPAKKSATIQLAMQFERPVIGERIWAEARIDRAGGTNIFASAIVFNEAGEPCARAQGIVRISRSSWDNPGSPAVN